jgi:hypothetical protein
MKTKIIVALGIMIISIGAWTVVQKNTNSPELVIPEPLIISDSPEALQPTLKPITNTGAAKNRVPSKYACVGEFCDGSGIGGNDFSVVKIPLIKNGGDIGCDAGLFFAPHIVPKTTAVLDATYKLLFDLKQEPEIKADGFRNTVAGYSELFYDRVILLDNGTAKVYLTGSMSGPGHCAEPEMSAQIAQAALQFPSVKKLEVYLNEKIFDWCTMDVSDGEGPCPEKPQLWITEK